jgi:uncharacterized linocin/CFP29 family protein
MDWLRRGSAPLSERVWDAIDAAVVSSAKQALAARRVADFEGPKGWSYVAEPLGTTQAAAGKGKGGAVRAIPDAILLTEIRAAFELPWTTIDAFERGGRVLDTGPAEAAAREVALAEDELAFYGGPGSTGFLTSKESPRVKLGDWSAAARVAGDLLAAVSRLDVQGIPGPYAAVLDPDHYFAYLRAAAERRISTEADRLEGLIMGIFRSPVIKGGALFSLRGGDFLLVAGGDLSVGYRTHDATSVHLFCVETIGAHLLTSNAVAILQ